MMSCEQEYTLDNNQFQSRIVVQGVFEAGKPWEVSLSTSRNILDKNSKSVSLDDASVEILDSRGDFLYKLDPVDGVYTNSQIYPESGKIYKLRVSHPDYPVVTASGYTPQRPGFKVNSSSLQIEDHTVKVVVDAEIYGRGSRDNYYVWEVIDKIEHQEILGYTSLGDVDESLVDAFLAGNFRTENKNGGHTRVYKIQNSFDFYRDDNVQGESTLETRNIENDDTVFENVFGNTINRNKNDNPALSLSTYSIQVMTLSSDLIQYYRKAENMQYSKSKGSYQSIESKLGNIKGGFGIFAGVNRMLVPLEE